MLQLKYLYENYDLAKFSLKNWEYDAETLGDCLQHFRISSNAVYPFLWQGKMRFLRLSPVSEKIESNLKGEIEFLCYLQSRSYPAVIPVASNSGKLVVTLDSVWGKYYASVFFWVLTVILLKLPTATTIFCMRMERLLDSFICYPLNIPLKLENGHIVMSCYGLGKR